MKKIIATILAVVSIFSTAAAGVPEGGIAPGMSVLAVSEIATGTCGENLSWSLDDEGTLTISGSGAMYDWDSSYDVPWSDYSYDIKTVMISGAESIGNCAFCECYFLESVTIPDSVTTIGDFAFSCCYELKSVVIPETVTALGSYAFSNTPLESITIPAGVSTIGEYLFDGCDSLKSVTLTNGISSIGEYMFSGCHSIESLVIPDSVTSIGAGAFYYCSGLESVTISNSATELPDEVFYGCSSLTSVTIPEKVSFIDDDAFNNCDSLEQICVAESNQHYASKDGVLFNKDMSYLILCPYEISGSYTIPKSVTEISSEAFQWRNLLESISYEEGASFSRIHGGMFMGCTNLRSISLPKTVSVIEFFTDYGFSTFEYCPKAPEIIIHPDNEYYLSENGSVFGYVDGSDTETELLWCYSSGDTVTIPKHVVKISTDAFYSCEGIKAFEVDSGNSIYSSFEGSIYDKTKETLVLLPQSIGELKIPATMKSIDYNAFDICDSRPEAISISDANNNMCVQDGVLYNADKTTAYYCVNRNPKVPVSLNNIEKYNLGSGLSGAAVVLFEGTEEQWAAVENGSNITVRCIDSETFTGKLGDNATWTLEGNSSTLVISGSGELYSEPFSDRVNFGDAKDYIDEIVIEEGITSIGQYTFLNCGTPARIYIPSTVTQIATLSINRSVRHIEVDEDNPCYKSIDGVLFNKSGTELLVFPTSRNGTYTVPDGVTKIGYYAFVSSCLSNITFPNTLTSIDSFAFSGCDLTSVVIPDSVTDIGEYAFRLSSELQSFTFSKNMTTINNNIFYWCHGLSEVIIPEGIEKICEEAFVDCFSLDKVYLPLSIKELHRLAFIRYEEGYGEWDLYYNGTKEDWAKINNGNGAELSYYEANIYYATRIDNESSEISVTVPPSDAVINSETELKVDSITDETNDAFAVLDDLGSEVFLYDIYLQNNGVTVQPSGSVTVRIKVPDGFDGTECKVYHVSSNGTATDMEAVLEDGYLVFTTDHFSYYAVVYAPSRLPGDINGDGEVTLIDSTILRRYLANWSDVTINESNADVNGDGSVTMIDSTILRRYLAGWDGVELK